MNRNTIIKCTTSTLIIGIALASHFYFKKVASSIPTNNLTLKNLEALAVTEFYLDIDVTIPCKEQKKAKCVERFYDANGNFIGTETFRNQIRGN